MEPNSFHVPPRKKLRLIAVDLDGTLAWPTWEPDQRRSVVGDLIPGVREKLQEGYDNGYLYFVHTARPDTDLEMILEWLKFNQIDQFFYHRRMVVTGKPLAHKYIDDKAVQHINEKWF